MPELQITDGKGRLVVGALSDVLARMLFPDDENRRIHYRSWHFAQFLLFRHDNDDDEVRGLPRSVLRNLMFGPSPNEFMASIKDAFFWGDTVGELVQIVMLLKKEIGPEASLNKAIKVVQHRWMLGDEGNLHNNLRSVSAIKKHWKELKQVAHLWAAFVVTGLPRWKGREAGEQAHIASDHEITAFLYQAEHVHLAWGAKHISKRQGPNAVPLIDPATAWRVPGDLELRPSSLYLLGLEPLSPEEVSLALDSRKK